MDVRKTPHIYTKRGIYYFSRRLPKDLRDHYRYDRVSMSLRTRSPRIADTRAENLATKLEEDWKTLRWRTSSDPLSRFLVNPGVSAEVPVASTAPSLTEAKELYLKAKGQGRSITFRQAAERAVGYLVAFLSDKPIDTYTRAEVNQFRDALSERGLSAASVRRTFNTIRAMVNFVAREQGLEEVRSFSGVYLGEEQVQAEAKRNPIPVDVIRSIQVECRQMDDEARWLVALISDTGMRLSEAAGLSVDDIRLDQKHPHTGAFPTSKNQNPNGNLWPNADFSQI